MGMRPFDDASCLIGGGDVEFQRENRIAVAFGEIRDTGQGAGGRRDPAAASQRRLGPNAAEAARCAGNEPDFVDHQMFLELRINSSAPRHG